jgi:enoyl-CoA hydratase/carnithine racemase
LSASWDTRRATSWGGRAAKSSPGPRGRLAALEDLYRYDLMATEDAAEGLRALLEKRKPVWRDR